MHAPNPRFPPAKTQPRRPSLPARARLRPQQLGEILALPALTSKRSLKVFLAGKLTALVAPGGGEIQMRSLTQALGECGVAARAWRPWEDQLADADIVHLFGSEPEHLQIVSAARRARRPVALSTIAWFDLASCWREPRGWPGRLSACARFMTRAAFPQLPSWRRRLYHDCDLLLPNSAAEAEQLMRYFDVPPTKIRVVPNGADPRFAQANPRPFARRAGGTQFALYPGRIEPRKNQLGFLRAMHGTNVPIVILGDPVPGHEAYFAACQQLAGPNVKFMGRREHDDPLLASAYAACGCVVLASWFETPGLVALEAGMSGVPLVLPRGGCAGEYFRDLADYVSPRNFAEIRQKVLSAMNRPRNPNLAAMVHERFSWQAAALATREAYEAVL